MAMTPTEIWPMIAGGAAVVFGAGQLAEKLRNNKYVNKTDCARQHQTEKEARDNVRLDLKEWRDNLKRDLEEIQSSVRHIHDRLDKRAGAEE